MRLPSSAGLAACCAEHMVVPLAAVKRIWYEPICLHKAAADSAGPHMTHPARCCRGVGGRRPGTEEEAGKAGDTTPSEPLEEEIEIDKSNVLVLGPTGATCLP